MQCTVKARFERFVRLSASHGHGEPLAPVLFSAVRNPQTVGDRISVHLLDSLEERALLVGLGDDAVRLADAFLNADLQSGLHRQRPDALSCKPGEAFAELSPELLHVFCE